MKEGRDAVSKHAVIMADLHRRNPDAFRVMRLALTQVLEKTGLAPESKVSVKKL